ncbi:SGNH/GDSL hydrolase family protein [Streptomyces cavernae]|uniref:SGNH/GDSL hydrolase family protein n=1 Tax=Streptomyces cavernae TaxID=2259034 RepID=UPI000FEBE70E|nr:SGNH/GDSL hydrolase family protein [Streptomyces cavernae]
MTHPQSRPTRKRRAAAGAAAASAALLSLCAPAATAATAQNAAVTSADGPNYVALGDSYASGAGLAGVKDEYCDRTTGSYSSLIAGSSVVKGLNRAFKDVTCSGATTSNFWNSQGAKPPQANALTPNTKLVTLSLGGNDVGFTGILKKCVEGYFSKPNGSPCKEYYTGGKNDLGVRINDMEGRIRDVLKEVRRRSPDAKVIVVGYPALFPDTGVGCNEVPFAKGDFTFLRDMTKKVNRALERQAVAGGVGMSFADTYTPTVGHDMCQPRERRWFESLSPAQNTMMAHPNEYGHYAMAMLTHAKILKP